MSRIASHEHITRSTTYSTSFSPDKPQISLIDHTLPASGTHTPASNHEQDQDAEQSGSELTPAPTPAVLKRELSRKLTNVSLQGSIRRAIERQKYARYQSSRYETPTEPGASTTDPDGSDVTAQPAKPLDLFERGRARAEALWRRRRRVVREEERDAVLDVLYENQRGAFFFGVPRYSNRSLIPIDSKPWQNADFRTSAVDIRNAQVPDPSWVWSWPNWYVDMDRDVDEQGWEYSFAFGNQFAWHGSQPWFHSFVRRRRWLRKRVRKDKQHKTKEASHELAPDYFTIHTKVFSAGSQSNGLGWSSAQDADDLIDKSDISDAGALALRMRSARLDREKLTAVGKFLNSASTDDIRYLAKEMALLMSLFIYQSSRRELLVELVQHQSDASKSAGEHSQQTNAVDHTVQADIVAQQKRAEAIQEAVHAAHEQIQKLEYWSDIRDMALHDSQFTKDDANNWDTERWQGLRMPLRTKSFSSKQSTDAPAAELHGKPEKQVHAAREDSETDSSAYTTAPSLAPSVKRAGQANRPSIAIRRDDVDNSLERFVTASEGPVSSIKPKEYPMKKNRRKISHLDGVNEDVKNDSQQPAAPDSDDTSPREEDEEEADEDPLQVVNAEDSRVDEA